MFIPPSVSLNGNDLLVLAEQQLADFGDGDIATFEFPNDVVTVKVGKNGNTIYALNNMGRLCEAVIRVLRGSPDDIFLNDLQQLMLNGDFPSFPLLSGNFTKRIGDGLGNVTNDNYALAGGVFKRMTGAKSNAEGDAEQAISVYPITFALAIRTEG